MKTILIVDDDPNVVTMLRDVMEADGYRVQEAINGGSALEQLGIDPPKSGVELPDVVLLDIMMPVIDGYTVASRMQGNPDTCRIPIVIITAKGAMRDVFEASPSVKSFIEKPFDPTALRDTVKRILSRAS